MRERRDLVVPTICSKHPWQLASAQQIGKTGVEDPGGPVRKVAGISYVACSHLRLTLNVA